MIAGLPKFSGSQHVAALDGTTVFRNFVRFHAESRWLACVPSSLQITT